MMHSDLAHRPGLPDAMRLLLAQFPKADWAGHPNFHGLVQFWLDRHLNFRRMTLMMQRDAQSLLDGGLEGQAFASRLARMGNQFLTELHGHHQIEDSHFFPRLTQLEPKLDAGFQLLERDHLAIAGFLQRFTTAANGALTVWQDAPALRTASGLFLSELTAITQVLDRHLTDEEELVVPVILSHGPEQVE
jgi:iron-sulfur cluster repair protein YtfE (RIC family)